FCVYATHLTPRQAHHPRPPSPSPTALIRCPSAAIDAGSAKSQPVQLALSARANLCVPVQAFQCGALSVSSGRHPLSRHRQSATSCTDRPCVQVPVGSLSRSPGHSVTQAPAHTLTHLQVNAPACP